MQAHHADEVVEFLNTKFTNLDLYDWMSGILEGVFRYFLLQTTAIPKLGENQRPSSDTRVSGLYSG